MPPSVNAPGLLLGLLLGAALLAGCSREDSAALLSEARTLAAAGDHKSAIIQLKNALVADGDNAEARFELGKLYLAQLDFASAEKELRRARDAGYAADVADVMIARALVGRREFQRLLDELPAPAGTGDADVALHALRATAELGLGRRDNARRTLEQAQASAPRHVELQLALAQLALADGKPVDAMKALDDALLIDPKHRDSLLLKGDLLYASGKPADAAATYREVLRIDPRHPGARLALAGIALSDNALTAARDEVNAALKFTPNNLQARYLSALIDFREGKTEHARDSLAAVLKSAPAFLPALQLGGAIEYALGNLQTAEAHLNKVLKSAPDNLYALRLLAAAQLRMGRLDDAARTIGVALKGSASDPGVLAVAGEIALAKRDFAEASAYFEQAATRDPENAIIRTELGISRLALGDNRALADLQAAADMEGAGSRAHTFIILDQLKRKQFDPALASIAALEKKEGTHPLVLNYRGAAYLGKQDTRRARASFEQALKLDPGFFPAAANLAQLDLQEKHPAAARRRFEGILGTDAKHLNAMLALAELALRGGDAKTHVGWLEKAAAAHPDAALPRLALARHLLARGEKSKALAAARAAVDAQPDNAVALDMLGTVQLALGDTANALGAFRRLAERQPGRPAPLLKIASAQTAAGDLAAARKTLEDALHIEPGYIEAQLMLGRVAIRAARFDEAFQLARQIQQQKPDLPAAFVLEGDAAYARKDFAGALHAFERAHALNPSGGLLARQLQVLQASGRAAEGEQRLAAWLAGHADDANARAVLAESLIKRGQYKAAAAHYGSLNRSNPGNLVILNNLAWALFEAKDAGAESVAHEALKLKPDSPNVLDTYGWILANTGQPAQGLAHLRKASAAAPDNAEIQWHMAYALYLTGDTRRALRELESLLASGNSFAAIETARGLQTKLSGR